MIDLLVVHNGKEFYRGGAVEHLLNLIKSFFERRGLDGRNLFRVLFKSSENEEMRIKIFELVFLVCFFCKDDDKNEYMLEP
jgi:hypothetical protein